MGKNNKVQILDYINRQSLLGLLFAQAGAIFLHFQRLPIWLIILAVVVFIWRVQIFRSQWSFPNRVVRTCLVLCSLAAVVGYYKEWYSLEPMVALLVLAFLLKLIEVEEKRDAVILIFVGFFVVASAFLFDQGIVTTLIGIVDLWLLTACLLVLHGSKSHYLSRRTTRTISLLLIQSVPLMLLMLFVFPRIGALWSVPLQSSSSVTGVSDTMSPGDFSQLTRSRSLAFRVSFEGNKLPTPSQRYWRGLVLTQFDGRRWQRQDKNSQNDLLKLIQQAKYKAQDTDADIRYQVVLEATNTRWLYGIPYAAVVNNLVENEINTDIERSSANELFLQKPVTQRIQYSVHSSFDYLVQETSENLRQALLLPRGFNPKTIQMARQWQRESLSTEAYIERVLNYYHQNFTYTLSPPKLGKHTADDFLFSTQRGFCEHFSSSFVIMMRAVGIPARVVTGYQGGEWNAADQYLIVRQYDAHAWAEVWLPQRGWVRIDPTAAVAPNRIEQGLLDTLSENEQELLDPKSLPSFEWINQLALRWDSLNYSWQRWVLSYDQDKQSEWLQKILGEVTSTRLAIALVVPGMLMLGFFSMLALRGQFKPAPQKVKLYQQLAKKLQRKGVKQQTGETMAAYCERATQQMPQKKTLIKQIAHRLSFCLYGQKGDIDSSTYGQIKRLIDQV